jgi:hypothetical protein
LKTSFWQRLKLEEIVGRDSELRSRHGRNKRAPSRRDEDVIGRNHFVVYFDLARTEKGATTPQNGDAAAFEILLINSVQTRNKGTAVVNKSLPIE